MKSTKLYLAVAVLSAVPVARAGILVPTNGPTDPLSAQFTLGDIYNRLNTGAAGVKRLGAFTEPGAGPGTATMFTTDQIMGLAPVVDNTNGAAGLDVVIGKAFWSLRTSGGTWGLQAGARAPAQPGKTGQTQCYDASNILTACPGAPAGQDGALQKGVTWPNPRFANNANGTVTDNLTGLIWLADASCATISPATWPVAMANAAGLASGACGLTDGSTAGQWRVPNAKELESLIDFAFVSPALSDTAGTGQWTAGNPFTNVQSSSYWSSSAFVLNPADAWYVNLFDGSASGNVRSNTIRVWPVRGGQ